MRIRRQLAILLFCVPALAVVPGFAQSARQQAATRGESLDRIAAIVGNSIILESEVDEEVRYASLQPYRLGSGDTPREQALNRLIDRTLILKQEEGFVQQPATEAEITEQEDQLRADLPECARYNCKSQEGWAKFLADHRFSEDDLRRRLKQRIEILRFIQQRFRDGVRISDAQIEEFYNKTMLPQYQKENVTPPSLETLHDRIEEVLMQQQVSALLTDWLKTLRDQGQVRILKEGEDAP